ncbi:unnamed protein product [Blepharisma stoltei]|uniref:Uncharacterized protein n=1 Tax=Blepharisma stoltei TaxID=1481888 RepID=A0AAU9K8A6_9CILI|nr:unnamed protein product [Blepharisma stoltei]
MATDQIPQILNPTQSQEDPRKRKKRDDDYKDLVAYNAELVSYMHKLEFTLLETQRKYKRTKILFKKYIQKLAKNLEKAGYTVPTLPCKFPEADEAVDLEGIWKELEENRKLQEEEEKKKKARRAKKAEVKTENKDN